MESMFDSCESIKNLNLSNFNTQNVTVIISMFNGCSSLKRDNINTNDKKS